jgi:penicillin-binding protein 1A
MPLSRAARLASLTLCLWAAPPQADAAFELPPIDRIVQYQPRLPLQVVTADGVEIAQFGAERRIYVPLSRIPKRLQDAVLAVEDTRFREHNGIDPKGMARAVLSMMTGGMKQGASTLTQQLVRTMLLTHRFTPERKAKEILLALQVEKVLSKDRILEIYLNEIFLGQRAYGFAAAAQTYFGKPLERLSIAETALLAGLPQNPHYANPVANRQRAVARQQVVLERMRVTGFITQAEWAAARAEKLDIRSPLDVAVPAGHVAEMARRAVVERFGTEAYTQGLRVVTSLRAAEQRAAREAVRRAVLEHDRRTPWRGPEDVEELPAGDGPELERAAAQALRAHRDDEQLRLAIVLAASPREVRVQLATGERLTLTGEALHRAAPGLAPKAPAALALRRGALVRVMQTGTGWSASANAASPRAGATWALVQWPDAQAAFVALDPASGRIRALVGGFDFGRQPFNHVTQAWRQPGSSFKPLLYSAALEQGVMPATVVDDLPFTAANGWSPQNSDGRFDGPMTVRQALAKSKNLVSVRVAQQVGVGPVREWAGRLGLDAARQPDNLTLALGTGSVTPLQMARAYATFANGGWRVDPVLVERITDAQGRVLFEAPPPAPLAEEARVLPARNAFVTTSLLQDVTRVGTAARAQAALGRSDVYGKTGTTDDAVDAWFAGFHPSVAAVAWVGYSEPRSLGERESGGGLALPIWIDYMATALKGLPEVPLEPPAGVLKVDQDWVYDEWVLGGWLQRLPAEADRLNGLRPAGPIVPGIVPTMVPAPGPAPSPASEPASSTRP